MPKGDWSARAKKHNGSLVVWIEQSTDPGLLKVNSGGVCFALTTAWIEAYTGTIEDRDLFVNSFRANEGKRKDGTSIPTDFLEQQSIYQAQLESNNVTLQLIQGMIAVDRKDERLKNMVPLYRDQQKHIYGKQAEVTTHNTGTSIHEVIAAIPVHPCYVAVGFRKGGGQGGHVVGFEVRPDRGTISTNFPNGLYEFFDANLGLYAFPTRMSMLDFFVQEVWESMYKDSYAGCTFQTATTGVASPEVGFRKDTTLDDELEKLMTS